jgi:hypothetical protein
LADAAASLTAAVAAVFLFQDLILVANISKQKDFFKNDV